MIKFSLSIYTAVFIALLANILPSTRALAATQGSLGATSTGTLNLSVTKPARANISGVNDLVLLNWGIGDGAVTLTDDLCIYSTRASGGYKITATGNGAGSSFALSNGGNTMSYSVTWNSGGVGALSNAGEALTSGVASSGLTNAATDSSTCNGSSPGSTARVVVGITESALISAPHGTYTGTLTLLITPN